MTALAHTLPRPLARMPSGINNGRSIPPGTRFGVYVIEPNGENMDGTPVVYDAQHEYTAQWLTDGTYGVTGHYLRVAPLLTEGYPVPAGVGPIGPVTLRDPSGDLLELAPGWYAWPADDEPVQGALL